MSAVTADSTTAPILVAARRVRPPLLAPDIVPLERFRRPEASAARPHAEVGIPRR